MFSHEQHSSDTVVVSIDVSVRSLTQDRCRKESMTHQCPIFITSAREQGLSMTHNVNYSYGNPISKSTQQYHRSLGKQKQFKMMEKAIENSGA